MDDIEVLFGLGHHAVVGRYCEEDEIDAVSAGEHVADKSLMSRDIDDACLAPVWKVKVGKAQVDGDPALFFFLQSVGILYGQSFDEARFAVVDMSRSADDVRHIFNLKFQISDSKSQG